MNISRVPLRSSGRGGVHGYTNGIQNNGSADYSRDTAWMRDLVVVAKNVPLWLAQLSREYVRPVRHLDEIPAEELAFLKNCGVSGIWLVGLWQRSAASAVIKKKSGAEHATASAYAVFDYTVDAEYGGESALATFRAQTRQMGIYLGCDMVPNHTGIDSLWLRQHPDWYLQSAVKPFPAYTFSGPNLSENTGAETRVEDGYFSRRDAAVVFEHRENGRTRYIYHGNDGTGLPWNDTAQLNHTLPEVRAALIGTALGLAHKFDFIRFDAAMTLLRDHYRRLWFPQAAHEAVIAGRPAGLEFAMPEFWRELVDAFRDQSPGTLLIAEAFWLTENYFIREIGMHRVYNSAFMHFLAEEKNVDFSAFMTEHLRAPETLNRFVNYLSTPDEKPAAEVFPNHDKYLGALKLMATLPGMPLIAPGQLEGFREKYAMDQKAPRLTEEKNISLIARHFEEISPLLGMRAEFSDARQLRWLTVEPELARHQVIAYETGAVKKYRVLFNNSPRSADVKVEGDAIPLKPYESRVELSASPPPPILPPLSTLWRGGGGAEGGGGGEANRYYSGSVIPVSA